MPTVPFVWTNDDIVFGQADKLRRQLDLIDRHGLPGVFFVIPKTDAGTIDNDPQLLRVIDAARAKGHEFYQHGYVHTPFESGVPAIWMLDFAPDVRRQYDTHRLEIEATHSLEALASMIEKGARIWRAAFHEDSPGYRPGWGAFCRNLYRALDMLGFEWVSSRIPTPTSWLWNQGLWNEPQRFDANVPLAPTKIGGGGLIEFPLGGDYAFTVPNDPKKIDLMVGLGVREFELMHERNLPFMPVSHWHGLERNGDTGYAVHEKMLPKIVKSGKAEPMGMAELLKRTKTA
ncbi:MAG: DUF2334 domain-containing protein [Planctomycetota bacterium]|nr:DUF2334 domain-containing protein [Planctomycetota bacterium]